MQHRDAKLRNVGLVIDHEDIQLGSAIVAGWSCLVKLGMLFFFFFFFDVLFFFFLSLIDFSHPCNEKQRKNTLSPYERGSVSTVVCHLFVVRVLKRSAVLQPSFNF